MKNFLNKIKSNLILHKKISIVILIGLIIIAYFIFKGKATSETSYTFSTVEKGYIVSSVTASGQVSATNTVELKPEASSKITGVYVKPGDQVKKGKLLFSFDSGDAVKVLRSANTNLEIAKLDLEKLIEPPKNSEVLAIEAAIAKAEKSKIDADKKINDAMRTMLNSSTTVYPRNKSSLDTAPTITGTYNKNQEIQIVINVYQAGSGGYFSAQSIPSGVVFANGEISTITPVPIGDSGLYIKFPSLNYASTTDWIIDLPNKTVASYEINKTAYEQAQLDRDSVVREADATIAENKQKINELYKPDELELKSKQLVVQQRQDAVYDAQETVADYYIYAPFDGTIASVDAQIGQSQTTILGTIITKQKIAEITLNEVDVSKVSIGDDVTLSFDAIEDLTLTGSVAEIDTVGSVEQGVVNYKVKVAFDADNEKVRPGMSVSATIITDSKQDVISLPSSAIKNSQDGSQYVETYKNFDTNSNELTVTEPLVLDKIYITTGISNDTNVEVTTGLKEGDIIITKITTKKAKTQTTANSAPSLLGNTNQRSGSVRTGSFSGGMPR